MKQPGISTGATQQIIVSSEEYIHATFFRAGEVHSVERAETLFFELPGAVLGNQLAGEEASQIMKGAISATALGGAALLRKQ